jgi:hypothetical protein
MTDAEIAGYMNWRGPGAYTAHAMKRIKRIIEEVQIREREACAKLCDEIAIDMWNLYKGRPPYKGDEEGRASDFTQGRSAGAEDCAEAIRKRSNT